MGLGTAFGVKTLRVIRMIRTPGEFVIVTNQLSLYIIVFNKTSYGDKEKERENIGLKS